MDNSPMYVTTRTGYMRKNGLVEIHCYILWDRMQSEFFENWDKSKRHIGIPRIATKQRKAVTKISVDKLEIEF